MKNSFVHIIASIFLSIFLAKGVTESFFQAKLFACKIALQADAPSEEQEPEKNAGEKETNLFFEKTDAIVPLISCLFLKEKIPAGSVTWSNISLPVSTPPPEIA